MPRYSIETQIEIEIDGDDEEALTQADRLLKRFHDQGVVTQGEPEWHYVLLEDCVRNLSVEEDAISPKATCRHCDREIVNNINDGWVCPEAGFDMDGDGMWRTMCEDNRDDPAAGHEPKES